MPKKNRTVNSKNIVKHRPSPSDQAQRPAAKPTSHGGARLQLPPGQLDLDALRSVTREWLVPRLVEEFLRVHGIELKHVGKLGNRLQPSLLGALVPGDGSVSEKIKSQAKRKTNIRTLDKGGRGKVAPRS